MAREIERLTVAGATRIDEPGMHPDGRGLYLQVIETAAGTVSRSWIFRYRSPVTGRTRDMGLGPLLDFNLLMARKRAEAARRLLADGIDPIVQREADRKATEDANAKANAVPTFKQATEEWWEANKATWSSAKNQQRWIASLRTHAFPKIGKLPVNEIDTTKVLGVIRPLWSTKAPTAKRLQERIETVLSAVTVAGHRTGPNPAVWEGNLDHLLPAVSKVAPVKHHAAMPYVELPAFMIKLSAIDSVTARALEFAILTASRTGSVIKAHWSEFDLDAGLWIAPARNMKGRREHRVPLCERAVELLRKMPRDGEVVFFGIRRGKAISHTAMSKLLEVMRGDCTVHGFRSSFRDWAGEETNFQSDICEVALAHKIAGGNATWLAYQRGDLLKKRRALMDAFGRYCSQPPRSAEVTPLLPRIAVSA